MPKQNAIGPLLACPLPCTERLLLEGGDSRIALNPETGLNSYGCGPLPDPGVLAFGSSTASTISMPAFTAADRLRDRLLMDLSLAAAEEVYARELERIRQELPALCGIADLPGLDVVIAASGADLHRLVAQLVRGNGPGQPCRVIMMDPDETGCGVPSALAGRHLHAASPARFGKQNPYISSVRLREADGSLKPLAEVDGEVEAWVENSIARGQRVLLVSLDVSKTGLLAPSSGCVENLRQRFPDRLEVLVDACQFRIAPGRLRAYLQQGCLVAVTGSKFLGGPSFSAALLAPEEAARRLRPAVFPVEGLACSTPAEWPAGWRAAAGLKRASNFGLLLRWEAALEELRAFNRVPPEKVVHFIRLFADAVEQRLVNDPSFKPLPTGSIASLAAQKTWDEWPTLFPFQVFHAASGRPLNRDELTWVYRSLLVGSDVTGGAALRCQLGQPVACGFYREIPVGALRLCLSARLIVEAVSESGRGAAAIIDDAMAALDQTKWLAGKILAKGNKEYSKNDNHFVERLI